MLQRAIKEDYCAQKMGLWDAMGGAFANVRTFCQLHGAKVCFTDMDHIVRDRIAQFPAGFCMVHVWNAVQVSSLSNFLGCGVPYS